MENLSELTDSEYWTRNDVLRDPKDARASEEARKFIESLPKNFVSFQKEAITEAMAGNSRKLNALREIRKAMPQGGADCVVREVKISASSNSELRIRIYLPKGEAFAVVSGTVRIASPSGGRAALLYLHGGGWTINSPEGCERFCRDFCAKNGVVVIAPDYRLAPENPYPCANEDCEAALEWLVKNAESLGVDKEKIYVGGDSAGGHLALCTAIFARDFPSRFGFSENGRGAPKGIKGLILFYPVSDLVSTERESYKLYASGFCLDADIMGMFISAYVRNSSDARSASPLYSDLHGLPKTLLISSECDVLRDESKALSLKLLDSAVPARSVCFEGATHIFITQKGMDGAYTRALSEASEFLKRANF